MYAAEDKGPEKPPAPDGRDSPVHRTRAFLQGISGRCLLPGSRKGVASPGFPISHETQDESLNFCFLFSSQSLPGYLLPNVTARTK